MTENIFNLFLFVTEDKINELGIVIHSFSGTDQEKISFLQERVQEDYRKCQRLARKSTLKWATYQSMMRLGTHLEVFEELYQTYNAPLNPLSVITPIYNGSPKMEHSTGMKRLDLSEFQNTPICGPSIMPDYLEFYFEDNKLDIPRLLNDDYFLAIKLLFSKGLYVSCAKLLFSFLDTVAFIDTGDVRGNFKSWLKYYADLTELGVSEEELWELRNGLLHMTNLNSKKIQAGVVAPIIMYVGSDLPSNQKKSTNPKYLNIKSLINAVILALEKWITTYNNTPEKLVSFVERYDMTISDVRVSQLY